MLAVTALSHHYISRRARERRRLRVMRPPKHNPTQLLLNTARIQPGSTVHLATWSACTAPGPPQESLVRNETRISVLAKPSLARMTIGQLCIAPLASRSRLAATEPGLEPRVSGDTASTAMQCLGPLRHPRAPRVAILLWQCLVAWG